MNGGTAFSYQEAKPMKSERGRYYYSKFLVTLNSNIRPTTDEEEMYLRKIMRRMIDNNFEGDKIFKNIRILEPAKKDIPKDQLLVYINVTFSTEVGKDVKGGRLHAHVIVDTKHTTKIHIKADRLRDELETYFGRRGHVDIKYFPSAEILEAYISKDIII